MSSVLRIGFVLLSSPERPIPSTRVAVLNMLPLLQKRGHSCTVLYAPASPTERPELPEGLAGQARALRLDLVVFQKVSGNSVLQCVANLRELGIASCFAFCDVVDASMVAATDGSVVVTEFLRSLHPPELQGRMFVVHDGIERPEVVRPAGGRGPTAARRASQDTLRAVLVTSAQLWAVPELPRLPAWLELTIVGRYAASPLQRLREASWAARAPARHERVAALARFLVNPRIRCVPWSEGGVYDELLKADIGMIPVQREPALDLPKGVVPDWARKSENRLTLKMATGLPVVASRIPAYESVGIPGRDYFLVDDSKSWMHTLSALRDPALRAEMGLAARAAVLPRFSMEHQADLLVAAMQTIIASRRGAPTVVRRESTAP